jgi:hypothetical protein
MRPKPTSGAEERTQTGIAREVVVASHAITPAAAIATGKRVQVSTEPRGTAASKTRNPTLAHVAAWRLDTRWMHSASRQPIKIASARVSGP